VKGCGGGAGKSAHRILRLWKGRGGAGEAGEVAAWPAMGAVGWRLGEMLTGGPCPSAGEREGEEVGRRVGRRGWMGRRVGEGNEPWGKRKKRKEGSRAGPKVREREGEKRGCFRTF
jgi:hypothetical protein